MGMWSLRRLIVMGNSYGNCVLSMLFGPQALTPQSSLQWTNFSVWLSGRLARALFDPRVPLAEALRAELLAVREETTRQNCTILAR